HHAIVGGAPAWRAATVPVVKVVTRMGKPAWFARRTLMVNGAPFEHEVDGIDRRSRRPLAGAYRKYVYDPPLAPIVEERAEYQLYVAALTALVDALAGRLEAFEATPSGLPAWPWLDGERPLPRVLHAETKRAGGICSGSAQQAVDGGKDGGDQRPGGDHGATDQAGTEHQADVLGLARRSQAENARPVDGERQHGGAGGEQLSGGNQAAHGAGD
ncbi:MAG: hypothetical protein VW338_16080, partial [Rhodospirillaceae bacterium]